MTSTVSSNSSHRRVRQLHVPPPNELVEAIGRTEVRVAGAHVTSAQVAHPIGPEPVGGRTLDRAPADLAAPLGARFDRGGDRIAPVPLHARGASAVLPARARKRPWARTDQCDRGAAR
jgi:hypothetical protein